MTIKLNLSYRITIPNIGALYGESIGNIVGYQENPNDGSISLTVIFNEIISPTPSSSFYHATHRTIFQGDLRELLGYNAKVIDNLYQTVYTRLDLNTAPPSANNNGYQAPPGFGVSSIDPRFPHDHGLNWISETEKHTPIKEYVAPKCECGAKSLGVKEYDRGHYDWCDVHESKYLKY